MRTHAVNPTLEDYRDWLKKAEYDLDQFRKTSNVYDLVNCFLDLNALPEWIEEETGVPRQLHILVTAKLKIMRGESFAFDMTKIDEIDHQLRFIRLFCNHAKHADPKPFAGLTSISLCATLPAPIPIKFDQLALHGHTVSGEKLAADVMAFWRAEIPLQ